MAPDQATRLIGTVTIEKWISTEMSNDSSATHYSVERNTNFIKDIDSFSQTKKIPEAQTMKMVGPLLACGMRGSTSCKKAVIAIVDLMNPFYTSYNKAIYLSENMGPKIEFTFPAELKEFTTNGDYVKPMMALRETIAKKIELAQTGQNHLGDFFTDAKNAFKLYGFSDSDAEEKAWTVMAIYSTHGAESEDYLIVSPNDPGNTSVFANLARIAPMLSYIDGASLSTGKVYSYPEAIQTTCDYTRPYHFWLAAYLAHKLKKMGFTPKDILKAVHGEEVTYENFGSKEQTMTKLSASDAILQGRHSAYVTETQKNIVFNDIGAFWAIKHDGGNLVSSIDADSLFLNTYNASGASADSAENSVLQFISPVISSATGYDSNTLFEWNKIFAPDIAEQQLLKAL